MLKPKIVWKRFLEIAQEKFATQETFYSPKGARYKVITANSNATEVQRLIESETSEAINFEKFSKFIQLINDNEGKIKRTEVGRKGFSSMCQSAIVNFVKELDWDETQQYIETDQLIYFDEAGIDLEKKVLRSVQVRQGQNKLKINLLDMYNNQCCVTRCNISETLQAAHIIPYAKTRNNSSLNALLLRADIHDLFDCHMLGIHPETLKVHLNVKLLNTEYGSLEGVTLLTNRYGFRLDREALAYRWVMFQEKLNNE